jgi:folate-binding protein YgfZ
MPLRLTAIIKCTEMLATPTAIPQSPAPKVTAGGLDALFSSAAFALLPDFATIRVSGEDRVRWLNGMATNSIAALAPDEACYNFFLNAQGRIQGDAIAVNLGESLLLQTSASRADTLIAMLDHFIIMDDVELHRVPQDNHSLLVAGSRAAATLKQIGLNVDSVAPLHLAHFEWPPDERVEVFHTHSPLIPRFELWSDFETLGRISQALTGAGAATASKDDLNQLRILEGTPLYGVDIRDRDLPQETAQTRALHFAKGCYLGQEIVERIRSRGNVHRTFSGFRLDGPTPAAGTQLFSAQAPEKPIGELTSVARIDLPGSPITLALGYIRREALESKALLVYPGGTATPTSLPFAIPHST